MGAAMNRSLSSTSSDFGTFLAHLANINSSLSQLPARSANTTPNPCIRRTPAHMNISLFAQDLSHRVNRNRCVSQNRRSHIKHNMSHAPSLLFRSHSSTTSLSTSTPVRPSIRPSTRPSLPPTSHGGLLCADPSHVSFGSLAETHSPARSREMKAWPMKKTVLEECTRTFSRLD